MDKNLISKLINKNEHIGDNADVIASLSKMGVESIQRAISEPKDNTDDMYNVLCLLKIILEKSLNDEDDSVQIGCDLENILNDYRDGVEVNLRLDGIREAIKND